MEEVMAGDRYVWCLGMDKWLLAVQILLIIIIIIIIIIISQYYTTYNI